MNNAQHASYQATARIDLPARATTPGWARRHAHAALGAWLIPAHITETTVLLVSEIVTNAVTAATAHQPGGGLITQTLRRQPGRIIIEVSDHNPSPPIPANAGPDDESGRGHRRPGRQLAMTATTTSPARRAGTVDRAQFQRMQALEDAIAYRTARLAAPCPDCGPPPALCDDHATDHSLITGYRSQRHQIATWLQARRQRWPAPRTREQE